MGKILWDPELLKKWACTNALYGHRRDFIVGSTFYCKFISKFIVKNMLTNHDFCMKMSVPAVSK